MILSLKALGESHMDALHTVDALNNMVRDSKRNMHGAVPVIWSTMCGILYIDSILRRSQDV